MPRPSVWAIRLASLHLLAGFGIAALLLVNKGLGLDADLWRLLPVHIEILLIGWMGQVAVGVAHWILPRVHRSESADPEAPGSRGAQAAFVAGVICLNAGVILAAGFSALPGAPQARLAGRILEISAGSVFALQAWRRLRA